MNVLEEGSFNTSLYHYFLWKCSQGSNGVPPQPTGPPASTVKSAVDGTNKKDGSTSSSSTNKKETDHGRAKESGTSVKKDESKGPLVIAATSESPKADKFKALMKVMERVFPDCLALLPSNPAWMPPDVCYRYSFFHSIHAENDQLRKRVHYLESTLQAQGAPLPPFAGGSFPAGAGFAGTAPPGSFPPGMAFHGGSPNHPYPYPHGPSRVAGPYASHSAASKGAPSPKASTATGIAAGKATRKSSRLNATETTHDGPPSSKKSRTAAASAEAAEAADGDNGQKQAALFRRVFNRDDVPEDVKRVVATIRDDVKKEKSRMQWRMDQLEHKITEVETRAQSEQGENNEDDPSVSEAEIAKLVGGAAEEDPALAGTHHNSTAATTIAAAAAAKAAAATSSNMSDGPDSAEKARLATVSFEERFKELEKFKKDNGHCRVPNRVPGLGRWVCEIRSQYKASQEEPDLLNRSDNGSPYQLTQERIARLEALGFQWSILRKTVPWDERFIQLLDYKEKYGNFSVPRDYPDNPSLGEWVHLQRKLLRQRAPVVTGERERRLQEIGFSWELMTEFVPWEERLEECREFIKKHGHLVVPHRPSDPEESSRYSKSDLSFIRWANRQRDFYRSYQAGRRTQISRERIVQLEEMGFVWDSASRGSRASVGTTGIVDEEEDEDEPHHQGHDEDDNTASE